MVLLVGCGGSKDTRAPAASSSTEAQTHTLSGTVVSPDTGCGGYTSFDAGQSILVRDGSQRVLGQGTLSPPTPVPRPGYNPGACAFRFTVINLPEAPFYEVLLQAKPLFIGQTPFPLSVPLTLDQLRQRNWTLRLPFFSSGGAYILGEPGNPGLPAP